jgi:hypothetical protein
MKSTPAKLVAAVILIAALAGLLFFQKGSDAPDPGSGKESAVNSAGASKSAIRPPAERGGQASSSFPVPKSDGERKKIMEAMATNRASVTIELKPDMDFFKESGGGLDEATLAALRNGTLSGEKLALALAALRGTRFDELPEQVSEHLASPDAEVRKAALAALAGSGEEGLQKAWDAVRDGSDPLSMLAVMKIAGEEGGSALSAILKEGIAAAHPQIRFEAVEMVEPLQGRNEAVRREVLGAAAASEYPEVALPAITELSVDPRKQDLVILFDYLGNPDPEVSESARGSIDFMIDQSFSSPDEARSWWAANGKNFDDELNPVD